MADMRVLETRDRKVVRVRVSYSAPIYRWTVVEMADKHGAEPCASPACGFESRTVHHPKCMAVGLPSTRQSPPGSSQRVRDYQKANILSLRSPSEWTETIAADHSKCLYARFISQPSAEPDLPIPFTACSFWECKFPVAARGALPGKFKSSSLLFAPVAFPKRHSPGNTASPRVCFHSTSKRLGSKARIPARNPRAFWSLSPLLEARIQPDTESPFPADRGGAGKRSQWDRKEKEYALGGNPRTET
jgi:hypothetical protein